MYSEPHSEVIVGSAYGSRDNASFILPLSDKLAMAKQEAVDFRGDDVGRFLIKSNNFSKMCYRTCFFIWLVTSKEPIFAPLS